MHASLQAEFASGRAQLLQARAIDVAQQGESLPFDCRGHAPEVRSPLIQDLIAQGSRPRPCYGQLQDVAGCARRGLFALGPLGQGSLWEITAVPEIVEQADQAACRGRFARTNRGVRNWVSWLPWTRYLEARLDFGCY